MRFSGRFLVLMQATGYNCVTSYKAPSWCKRLTNIPEHKVTLAQVPTPIHPWNITNLPSDVQLYIKRDDLTGSTLSGNKVRKLEFLLADAIKKGCKSVITCGGLQSNHARATTVAASQLGLKTHLLLRSDCDKDSVRSGGNLFLSQMCNASIYLIPKRAKYETEIKPRQEVLAEEILAQTGDPAYPICVGGSDPVGLHGYLTAWEEMIQQGVLYNFDDVVITCGSGGSTAGLAIGNYLTGAKVKVHAIAICDDAEYFHGHVNDTLQAVGLKDVQAEDIVDIVEGYKGAGYGASTPDDHNLYRHIASTTGVFCDPVYTGKGIKGLISELKNNKTRFKGNRILFVHTGGIFGLYDGRMFNMFENHNDNVNIFDWYDVSKHPKIFS